MIFFTRFGKELFNSKEKTLMQTLRFRIQSAFPMFLVLRKSALYQKIVGHIYLANQNLSLPLQNSS